MAPLARADPAAEAWALAALGPLIGASARAVYPLPDGGATHMLLLPAASRERALRVTPGAAAMAQSAALRVAFLQLGAEDAAASAKGETVLVDVTSPEEHASHALVVIARPRGRGAAYRLWVFSDDEVTVLEHSPVGHLIVEEPLSLEAAAAALLAGVERACPAREAARLRKAGGPRPEAASEWTPLQPSRLPPATPGEFEAAVGAFARETRAAVAAAAARAVAAAQAPGASDDAPFSYDDDGGHVPFGDDAAWGDDDDAAQEAAAAAEDSVPEQATPRATVTPSVPAKALAASSPPRKRSPRGGAAASGGGSAFARRRRVRLTLGLTPATAPPAPRRKRIFSDATPAERDDADDDKAFDTPRGAKRARRAAASPAQGDDAGGSGSEEEEEAGDDDDVAVPSSQPLLSKISQVARWVIGMS